MYSGHPILLDTVRRIYAKTVEAEHNLRADAKIDSKGNIADSTSVLEWTGLPNSVSFAMIIKLFVRSCRFY